MEMDLTSTRKNIEQKMQRSIDALSAALVKIRTGRAHTGLLDHIQVDYYGARVPIAQVANLTLIDARTIGVTPWEKKIMPIVEKAIRESDLGLNPSAQGDFLRVPMPPLTEERRRDLVKVVKHEGEAAKIAIRAHRRDANEQLKKWLKEKEISEDDERREQESVQKRTDAFIARVDALVHEKEKEIMTV